MLAWWHIDLVYMFYHLVIESYEVCFAASYHEDHNAMNLGVLDENSEARIFQVDALRFV